MTPHTRPTLLLSLALPLLLAGCSFHPDTRHELALQQQSALKSWSTAQQGKKVAQLPELIGDARLTALIHEALANSPDLKQTLITLQQAVTSATVTNSDRLPEVTAGFSGQKIKESDPTYSPSLTISWELDFWGRLHDKARAAELDITASALALQQAQHVLAADVMRAWLEIVLDHQLVAIQQERVALLASNHQLIVSQYQTGLGDLDDLDSAKAAAEKARSTLEGYRRDEATATRTLHLLLGHSEQNTPFAISDGFPQVVLPLASLPKQDLGGRPDLQKAYTEILADEQTAKASYKALLPSFSLTGSYYDSDDTLRQSLFTSPLWSLLGELSAPIFSGGSLRAQAKSADLDTAKSYYAYQEDLLTAINEVEDSLAVESSAAKQEKLLASALKSSRQSLANYTDKYRRGLTTIYELISAQTDVMDLRVSLLNKQYERLNNRINLGQALGLGVNDEEK